MYSGPPTVAIVQGVGSRVIARSSFGVTVSEVVRRCGRGEIDERDRLCEIENAMRE